LPLSAIYFGESEESFIALISSGAMYVKNKVTSFLPIASDSLNALSNITSFRLVSYRENIDFSNSFRRNETIFPILLFSIPFMQFLRFNNRKIELAIEKYSNIILIAACTLFLIV
jgi:hypothetical protein